MSSDKQLEIDGFPDDTDLYKFVQVLVGDRPVMAFARATENRHGAILEAVLRSRDVPYRTRPSAGLAPPIPEPKGRHYALVGAGDVIVCFEERMFRKLQGRSIDYTLGPDAEFGSMLERALPEGWTMKR